MDDPIVQFYDPHPGLMGCPEPLPEGVRIAAEGLNGKTKRMSEALEILEAGLIEDGVFEVHDDEDFRFIGLKIPPDSQGFSVPQHCWRVIRFAPKLAD
jgi:hypothetical protein